MSYEDIELMITKDYIVNAGIISIDTNDMDVIRKNSDFMDGCKKVCYAKEMKSNLQFCLDELTEVHKESRLSHLAVKLLVNKESELMISGLTAISEVFDTLSDVETIWGVAKNDCPQNGKVAVCVVCGFKNI